MALTGRGPCNSSTRAAGCQYIRISFPQGSLGPVRVIRSLASWLIMAVASFGVDVPLLNYWANYDISRRDGKDNLWPVRGQSGRIMPKLKRSDGDERATDFVESLDRGLRLLQK